VVAKYGIITILDQSYDVCDLVKKLGKECPIPAGTHLFVCVCAHMYIDTHTNVLYSNCCFVILHIGPVSGSTIATIPSDVPGVSIIAKYAYIAICSGLSQVAHAFTQFYVHLKFSYNYVAFL